MMSVTCHTTSCTVYFNCVTVQISDVTTNDEYERLVNQYGSMFADMGISRMMISGISEKNAIIKSVLKHLILYR